MGRREDEDPEEFSVEALFITMSQECATESLGSKLTHPNKHTGWRSEQFGTKTNVPLNPL